MAENSGRPPGRSRSGLQDPSQPRMMRRGKCYRQKRIVDKRSLSVGALSISREKASILQKTSDAQTRSKSPRSPRDAPNRGLCCRGKCYRQKRIVDQRSLSIAALAISREKPSIWRKTPDTQPRLESQGPAPMQPPRTKLPTKADGCAILVIT